jgi:hypothetical protein
MVKRVVVGVDQWKEVRRKEVGESGIVASQFEKVEKGVVDRVGGRKDVRRKEFGESGIVVSWTEKVVVDFDYRS